MQALDGAGSKSGELCSTPFHVLKADVTGDAYDGYADGKTQVAYQASRNMVSNECRANQRGSTRCPPLHTISCITIMGQET